VVVNAIRAEASIRCRTAEERQSVRNTQSRPLVEAMKPWLETQLGRIPGGGGLAEAIRYTLSRWPALCHFRDNGRIDLDNNSVERAIWPVALGRKNHLFAGSDVALSKEHPTYSRRRRLATHRPRRLQSRPHRSGMANAICCSLNFDFFFGQLPPQVEPSRILHASRAGD
jgi:hypothetical protein